MQGQCEIGFIGHGHGNASRDQGRARIGGGHGDFFDVRNGHAILRQGIIQENIAGGAFFIGHLFALETLDVRDRAIRQHGIGGSRHIKQGHDLDGQSCCDEIHGGVGGNVAALQLAGGQRGVDIGIGVEVDNLDCAETGLGKECLFRSDVPLAIAQPWLNAHFDVACFRCHGNVISMGCRGHERGQGQCSTGFQHFAACWHVGHGVPLVVYGLGFKMLSRISDTALAWPSKPS